MAIFTSNIPMIINNTSAMIDVSAQNMDLSGNLNVSGSSTLSESLDVSGDVVVDGTLDVSGGVAFGDRLDVSGDVAVDGNVGIGGGSSSEKLKVYGDVNITGNIIVDGSFSFSEVVQNTTTINNTLLVSTQLDVSNEGTGPALKVSQLGDGDDQDVALFNAGDEGDALKIDSSGNTFVYKDIDISGDTSISGTLSLKSSATSSASTQIPVFISDPASTAQTLVTRTPTQLLGDIGALSVVNLGITSGSSSGPVITNSAGTNVTIPTASSTASGIVTTGTQTFKGTKTFSDTITATISGNAGSVTNGVYIDGSQTIRGKKRFTNNNGLYINSVDDPNSANDSEWSIETFFFTRSKFHSLDFVAPNGSAKIVIFEETGNIVLNFTGQHRTFIKNIPYTSIPGEYEGLIVCANQNTNILMSGSIKKGNQAITQNETLPYCSLACKDRDKSCFGVISEAEDPNERVDKYGAFCTPFKKEKGDTRVYINSVGEGAIWVTNKNGSLESGDYITTCDLSGYGMKQDDDILHNYTVAKITMNCDFNPVYQPVPTILKDTSGENILDEYGQIQWTDLVDSSGNVVYEYEYNIRYLDASGQIIDKDMSGGFIGAYVGCTYHCG